MGYSRAWSTRPYQQPAMVGTLDPQHRQPTGEDAGQNWQAAPAAPPLTPPDQVDDAAFSLDAAAGGYPWNPPGHSQGVGFGAGLSFAASSAQNDAARNTPDGSYLPRVWQPAVDRDGEYHVDRQQWHVDTAGIGSQAQVDLGKQLNPAAYPNRRTGHYITRWRDRVYERRNWGVEFRPIVVPNAYSAPPLAALPGRSRYNSPYPDAVATNVRVVNTAAPQMRRTPKPWDQSVTQDGTVGSPWSDPSFNAWGL